jgi:hypothetical protein
MPFFYVLHVKAKPLADCLDAIRFLCNPIEKQRAHITVRGPYRKRIDVKGLSERVNGGIVSFDGVGNFFNSRQNTVFFRCSAPRLRAVWSKPDFPFNPHLTIYDGKSSEFAHRLFDLVSRYEYPLRFRAEELEAIESRRGQSSMSLALAFNSALVRKAVGRGIVATQVPRLSERRRLELIDRLCKYLATLPKQRSSQAADQPSLPFPKEGGPLNGDQRKLT